MKSLFEKAMLGLLCIAYARSDDCRSHAEKIGVEAVSITFHWQGPTSFQCFVHTLIRCSPVSVSRTATLLFNWIARKSHHVISKAPQDHS